MNTTGAAIQMVKDGVPRLTDLFKDSHWHVRQEAVMVFGKLTRHGQQLVRIVLQTVDKFSRMASGPVEG
jgi:hypothetical protein